MSRAARILAIDQGTQSTRALVFDQHGEMIARSQVPIEPYFSDAPGQAEQTAEYYWQSVCRACHLLWSENPGLDRELDAVTLTTQRSTVVCLDGQGRTLRPAIVWLDQRRAGQLPRLPLHWRLLFRVLGLRDTLTQFQSQAQSVWLRQHEPATWQRTAHYLLLSGYLGWRMTGELRDSVASQVGYLPFDFRRQQWASAHDWKWRALDLTPAQMPELVSPGQPLGHITAEAARDTGLPAGLAVIAAGADKACEVVGSGAFEPDTACLSYGTTATINTTRKRYFEAIRLLPPYPSPVPGHYCTEVQIYRGFWMVKWFHEQFAAAEHDIARQRGMAIEQVLEEMARETPPGALGLMLQPYWSPGTREPGPEAKGSIIGFGDVHTRAHVYRAVLEGLAYGLRQGREHIERRGRVPVRRLLVSGGGSRSDLAMQITADIFGLPAERPHTWETSGLGAAMTAAVGLGIYPDFRSATAHMTRVRDVFHPDPANRRLYDRLYRRVYRRLYARLKPLYRDIKKITGYPAS